MSDPTSAPSPETSGAPVSGVKVSRVPAWLAGRHILPEDMRPDGNSFTALRWILASAVMISHAWDLTHPVRGLDPSVVILSFPVSRLAVFLFFTLSGFLVTGSLFKRGYFAFLTARALRLLPGLWVMLLVVPFVLWWAFGTMTFGDFVRADETQRFIWRNALLLGGEYQLPGIFDDHYLTRVVNGSLWTIPYEVRCYIALAVAAAIGLTQPRWRFTILLLAGFIAHLLLPEMGRGLDEARRLGLSFFLGVAAWLWRERLLLSWPLVVVVVAAALAVPDTAQIKVPLIQLGFGYLVLVSAFCVPARWKAFSARMPDYSYGIYIYAFPAQQAAVALGVTDPWANIGIAFLMTLPVAALSWHIIEKPALAFKTGNKLPPSANMAAAESGTPPATK